ncbi:polysaccharide deacetylase family protein [Pseudohongiella sp.]|uniref:NodB homology domain-containing protein n=1 Tax=marine sediment metagenome TaxID=412755 RepID=A0A0F9Z1A0_9ZZZZ|nr:polysaccharide deacetylase family protein [Pseudohongiella sp.]HDZ08345.1 hypothetical protein [Pseudohongiella sp.]HEA61934.1 hypothetical protein [Pseudohongiella sp.]
MNLKLLVGGTVAIAGLAVLIWLRLAPEAPVFPDLTGPSHTSVVPAATTTTLADYPPNGRQSMAIWVKDPDSSWLGLALGFKSIGLPFTLVTDINDALTHRVVLVYPSLTGSNTTPEALEQLRDHVHQGGTLLGFSVLGGGMPSLFGFTESEEHARRQRIEFNPTPLTETLISTEVERTIQLGNPAAADSGLPGVHYLGFDQALAQFEDGSAVITHKSYQLEEAATDGQAYAFGLDIGHFILRAYNGRFSNLADTYVNAYQPQVDTLLRLITRIYQQGEPDAVILSPTPHGRDFTALMTHDVDFTRSINNIPAYVALEKSYDIPATYFIQTKYVTDYNDRRFFDPSRAATLTLLLENGMEVASHSVAHSNEFARMPLGTGLEQYPDYRPFVRDFSTVENASIMGELRVSKFLLESLSDTSIVSFRPGHLSLPEALPQLLVANGYRYSSSITANEAMTHLPYRLTHDRTYGSQVNAFEFPVTIEDEYGRVNDRFDEIVTVSNQVAQYQGLVNLMIHTDELGEKLTFVQRYLAHFKDQAWFDTVSGYGDWWAARNSALISVSTSAAGARQITVTVDHRIDGLTLRIPSGWQYRSGLDGTVQQGDRLILGSLENQTELLFWP